MRITLLCSDFSNNGVSRLLLLSDILGASFDVEIVGTLFGNEVWEPARDRRFHAVVKAARWPFFVVRRRQLLRAIRGDVVYALKPLPTSYGVALLHRARTGTPVVLDVDDDELAFRPAPALSHPLRVLSSITTPNGRPFTSRAVQSAHRADAVTVASTGLQRRFGGTIVPHAKDTSVLKPGVVDGAAARAEAGFTAGQRLVMFVGTPRPFKGIEDVAESVRITHVRATFVVAGADPRSSYVQGLARSYPEISFLPPYRFGDSARLLEMADVIVVPQRREAATEHQQPSKLLDAMALEKAVIATSVADIPEILGEERGWVVPPSDVGALAAAIDHVLANPAEARERGRKARRWCVEHASYAAMEPVLAGIMADVRAGRSAGRQTRDKV